MCTELFDAPSVAVRLLLLVSLLTSCGGRLSGRADPDAAPSDAALQDPDASGIPDAASTDSPSVDAFAADASDGSPADRTVDDSPFVPDVVEEPPHDAGPEVGPLGSGSEAVAYHVDPAHTGAQLGDTLTLPLAERWRVTLAGNVSYPLVAGGRVFVTVFSAKDGTDLYALNEADGTVLWGPVPLGGLMGAAYEKGRLFTAGATGLVTAWDPATGAALWQTLLSTWYPEAGSPPTAARGIVYTFYGLGGAFLFPLDEATGGILPTYNFMESPLFPYAYDPPTLTPEEVVMTGANVPVAIYTPDTDATVGYTYGGCEGDTATTVAYKDGNIYTRDCHYDVLDAVDAALVGNYPTTTVEAFSDSSVFVMNAGTLSAFPLGSPAATWSFTGDGTLDTEPVVVGSTVVVGGASGMLYALDAVAGTPLSSVNVGVPMPAPNENDMVNPLQGMAAADDRLFVAAGSVLVVY